MKLTGVDLSHGRISDRIKNTLKQSILSGEFKPGEKLPREDQLAASFKVSKVSVREALRDLEGEGIIEKRRGIHGGNFVAQPGISKIDDLMSNLYHFGTITEKEFFEFGALLEQALVPLLTRRRTEQDLERMRKNIEEREAAMATGKLSVGKIPEFYRILADSCKNKLCSALVRSFIKVSNSVSPRIEVTRKDCEAFLAFSKELYECIRNQDESAAMKSNAAYIAVRRHFMIRARKRSQK